MTGLVLFLHGLFGDETSWHGVPDFVEKYLGSDFDVRQATYSAGKLSPSDLETSAGEVLTFLKTKFPDHQPIFLIGHSLGGLVAREACRKLLVEGPDELLQKITAVITAGTPLEGVPYFNWLLRGVARLNPKVAELANPEHLFAEYRLAIRKAREREPKPSRPKLLHLRFADDRVIAKHVKDNFTDDDDEAGVLPGTHTGFAKGRQRGDYVAEVLVQTIRDALNAVSAISRDAEVAAPHISRSQAAQVLPDRLILIACSHTKNSGGAAYSGEPLDWVPETSLRQDLLAKRNFIFSALHDGKLEDNIERGGNRSHQPANENLVRGRDIGGSATTGQYLPAFERYAGRLYHQIGSDGWQSYLGKQGGVKVLIMSGLYGLIEPTEAIQNYDIHLTDTHKGDFLEVKAHWLELYTRAISAYVRHAHTAGRKVNIFNFLCDRHYVDAVRWHSLPRDMCSVFHFVAPGAKDVGLLPPAGFLIKAILNDPSILERFERGKYGHYALTDYGHPPTGLSDFKFGFESRVGLSSSAGATEA
ncbi:peroxide stress protein YaaA [Bradyrhizobium sp. SBR1B]|uniref:peroxide stress protein YaaA n=1 Tax=Bradyrhizobium sp. SBR1B TaxID=2663836 RepID=UPI0016060C71|nr:peroxide stress protein YaaA [Bradyrhizobium sp. SBR1B]MBB4376480.1 pimeloyl-ACP methyl ester carboxylesterase/cytoplasmic iron level regulating protein YaaA (DUF328/UPF0246 family) [Bradyrhizobium sp. SBR1B]